MNKRHGTGPLRPKPERSQSLDKNPDMDLDNYIHDFIGNPGYSSSNDSGSTPKRKRASADNTSDLSESDEDGAPDEPNTRQLRMLPKLATDVQPWRVIFQTMTADPKVVGVDVQDVAVVGRSDPNLNTVPDLDLAPHGAQGHGVSRRHAILLPTDEGLCLIDLDSTNGTWINGVYLQPGQKYRVRSGDRVEFGRLRLVVRVVGSMLQSSDDQESTAVTRPKPPRK